MIEQKLIYIISIIIKLIYIISIIILVVSMAFILLNIRLERQDKVESMIDSLKQIKEEQTTNEAKRLVNNDKAIS